MRTLDVADSNIHGQTPRWTRIGRSTGKGLAGLEPSNSDSCFSMRGFDTLSSLRLGQGTPAQEYGSMSCPSHTPTRHMWIRAHLLPRRELCQSRIQFGTTLWFCPEHSPGVHTFNMPRVLPFRVVAKFCSNKIFGHLQQLEVSHNMLRTLLFKDCLVALLCKNYAFCHVSSFHNK